MRKNPSIEKSKELEELFVKAEKEKESKMQIKLVKKARNFAKHENMSIPMAWKDKFCRKCNSFFNAKNQKIRLSKGKISRKCLNCNYIKRKKFKVKRLI